VEQEGVPELVPAAPVPGGPSRMT